MTLDSMRIKYLPQHAPGKLVTSVKMRTLRLSSGASARTTATVAIVEKTANRLHHQIGQPTPDIAKGVSDDAEHLDRADGVLDGNPFPADHPVRFLLLGGQLPPTRLLGGLMHLHALG